MMQLVPFDLSCTEKCVEPFLKYVGDVELVLYEMVRKAKNSRRDSEN